MSCALDLLSLAQPSTTLLVKPGHQTCTTKHDIHQSINVHCTCQCNAPINQSIPNGEQIRADHDYITDLIIALDYDTLHQYLIDQSINQSANFDSLYFIQVLFNALLDATDQLINELPTVYLNRKANEWAPMLSLIVRSGHVGDALEASNEIIDRALTEQSDQSTSQSSNQSVDCISIQLAYTFQSFIEAIIMEIATERQAVLQQSAVIDKELEAKLAATSQAIQTVESINQSIKEIAAKRRIEQAALELRCSSINDQLEIGRQNREARRKRELVKDKDLINQSLESSRSLVVHLSDQLSIIRREESRLLNKFESDRAVLTAANSRWSQVNMLQKEIAENEAKMNSIDQQIAAYQSKHEKISAAKTAVSVFPIASPLISNTLLLECGARDLEISLWRSRSSPKLFFRLSEIPADSLTNQSTDPQSVRLHTFVESPCFPSNSLTGKSPTHQSLKNPSWPSIKVDVDGLSETALLRIDVCDADNVVEAVTSPNFAAAQGAQSTSQSPSQSTNQSINRKTFEWVALGSKTRCLASAHLSLAALRRCGGNIELQLLTTSMQFFGMFRIIRCDWQ